MKIRTKLMINPLIAFVFFVGLVASVYWGMTGQKRALENIYSSRFGAYAQCSELYERVLRYHSDLFKMIAWSAGGYDSAQILQLQESSTQSIGRILDDVTTASGSAELEPQEKELYARSLEQLKDYMDWSGRVTEMAASDLSIASMFMGTAEDKMVLLQTTLVGLQATERKLSDAAYLAAASESDVTTTLILCLFAVAIAASLTFSLVLSGRIMRPLKRLVGFADRIALGDLQLDALSVPSRDELGLLADSFNRMLHSLQGKAQVIQRIASGNLADDVVLTSENDRLGEQLSSMQSSLRAVLAQVNRMVEQVSAGAQQVSQASQSLSQGAAEQASSLEEISSALSEINGQSKQNAEHASEASTLSRAAAEAADSGNNRMRELVEAMKAITVSSEEITKVVKAIDDIAFQINLLALNANVEAARAGKYGRGFAVVADEVRNLATRSAKAVSETSRMVERSMQATRQGNTMAEATAKQLEDIVGGASKTASFLNEIAQASTEQAHGIQQVDSGLGQIGQVTQGNTANAEQSAAASEELASQAQELREIIARFKLPVARDARGKGDVGDAAPPEREATLTLSLTTPRAERLHAQRVSHPAPG